MTLLLFLSTALLNLLLGIGMALAWEWFSQPASPKRPRAKTKAKKEPATEPEPQPKEPPVQSEPVATEDTEDDPVPECVPEAWIDMLTENAVVTRSFVEATAQVLRLKIMAYREKLARIEDQIRRLSEDDDTTERDALVVELIEINGEWLNAQSEAMGALIDRRAAPDKLAHISAQLEDALLEQTAKIETARMRLEMAQEAESLDAHTIVTEIQSMLACAHRLRDLMQESLAAILATEERYDEYDEAWQLDSLCGVMNRAGIELLIHHWRGSDHARQAENSLMLLDIEQFEQTNERFGAHLADQLLTELCSLLTSNLRKERGFDRIGRFSGQQFLTILGSTSTDHAASVAERLRQTVQQAVIRCGETELPLRIRAAVIDLSLEAPLDATLERLQATLTAAKQHDESCSFLDCGTGAALVVPTPSQLDPVEIELDSELMVPDLALEPVGA